MVLVSKEGDKMSVDRDVATMSVLIKNLLEDVEDSESPIPLPNVSHDILKKIMAFCEHHKNEPVLDKHKVSTLQKYEMDEWDKAFFNVEKPMLFEIILASSYMDTKLLTQTASRVVANMIAGMSPNEVKAFFDE